MEALYYVYYCYNSPSLKGSDVWTVTPVPVPVPGSPSSPALIVMQGRSSGSQDWDFLFSSLLPPPPPWEWCKPALIAPTLEQLTLQNSEAGN